VQICIKGLVSADCLLTLGGGGYYANMMRKNKLSITVTAGKLSGWASSGTCRANRTRSYSDARWRSL
jgi:hypothetical protein